MTGDEDLPPWEEEDQVFRPSGLPSPVGPGRIEDPGDVKTFLTAGHATVTLVSLKTGRRFTYRLDTTDNPPDSRSPVTHFVKVLSDPDDDRPAYLGHVFRHDDYTHGVKSKIAHDADEAAAFRWFWRRVVVDQRPPTEVNLEVWHDGRCGCCVKRLTTPESLPTGICPQCREG